MCVSIKIPHDAGQLGPRGRGQPQEVRPCGRREGERVEDGVNRPRRTLFGGQGAEIDVERVRDPGQHRVARALGHAMPDSKECIWLDSPGRKRDPPRPTDAGEYICHEARTG
jgi:hypothetical protein